MTSISFIVPSWHYWEDPLKHQPYWELYYATILRERFSAQNVDVNLVDLRGIAGDSLSEVVTTIPERAIYLYWIFKSGDAMEVYSMAKLLKKRYPRSIHAAGGTHVDMCTEECMNFFDAVVVGPGEESFAKIVQQVSAGHGLTSRLYQQKYTEVPFADTPFPRRDFLSYERVVNDKIFSEYNRARGTLIYFSRGCVYRCAFCVYNVPSYLQVRSREKMREELSYLKEDYKVEAVLLKDEVAIHPNQKISTQVFEALGESGLIWRGQTTSLASHEQLKMARESGCQELAVGVETVDDQVMQIVDKKWQTQAQIKAFLVYAKEVGIKIKLCLIFGLPGEPRDIVDKTIKFLEETNPEYVSLSGFCPVPGSPIFKNPQYYGIKSIDKDWGKHAHLLYRYSDSEEVGLPFEYENETRWGKAFTREQIRQNIQQVQRWLEGRGMIY